MVGIVNDVIFNKLYEVTYYVVHKNGLCIGYVLFMSVFLKMYEMDA
jgi:hypothetical protein